MGGTTRAWSLMAAALIGAAAGGQVQAEAQAAAEEPLRVLATIGMIGEVAERIGGDCAVVETLMGPGTDPHRYQPTASDVDRFQRAELILHAGFGLEGQLGAVLARMGARTPTLAVAEAAAPEAGLIADPDEPAGIDPHLWMDVSLWAGTVPAIAAAIGAERPACIPELEARAAAYQAELAALHDWVGAAIATIPEDNRILITAHDAFGYYARAYGIAVSEAVAGISTEAEASIADILAVADVVVETGVPAVFVETTINPRTIEALVEAVQNRGHAVEIGGALYSDAMGDPGTPSGTYIGMIHANTRTIVAALGGTPPPLPDALADWAGTWGIEG